MGAPDRKKCFLLNERWGRGVGPGRRREEGTLSLEFWERGGGRALAGGGKGGGG